MPLLQSVRTRLSQTKNPQQRFLTHLLGLMLMLPGHATFRHLSRYSPYHERSFARGYARAFDCVSLNKAAITAVVPAEHEQALVMDASFVPKSGKKTSGLDHFWNGSHSRTENGLEISAFAWLDITGHCAYCLSVEQTPPTSDAINAEATRIDGDLKPLSRVVSEHDWGSRHDVVTEGYDRKQKCMGGVRSLGLHQIGKLRADANGRDLDQGPKGTGPGRPKTSDGKVHWSDLSRFEKVDTEDDHIVLYHQILTHVQFQCNLCVVVVVDTPRHRRAGLLSPDVTLDALTRSRADNARFHIEFWFRDAKQFTGLTDGQARSQAKLGFHFHASLTAVSLTKLEARQQSGQAASSYSMASLKRRAFNQQLIDRIGEHFANGHRLEKSSPEDNTLGNDGLMTELAA